ncbi:hypothetical protein [Kitasatospora sp. NBC_01266]|uniref:hypothetical protein n=1 Tax=Kitasatospora sp. NBC_01266 TaxID=2903572 RepID=UPI002E301047|nr:hypothetical protein [Kitasatospora sp. NBC_01266]
MSHVLMRRLATVATSTILLGGLAAGAAGAAYAADSTSAGPAHTAAATRSGSAWDRPVDKQRDRNDHGTYWREAGGVKARWNAEHRYWERQAGSRWEHWNGHRWVA